MKLFENISRRRSSPPKFERPTLCIACTNLSLRRLLEYEPPLQCKGVLQALTWTHIKAQKRSCCFCSLLFASITKVCDTRYPGLDWKILSVAVGSFAKKQLRVMLSGTWFGKYSEYAFEWPFYLQDLTGSDTSGLALADQRAIDFGEVTRWMTDCTLSHGIECHPATKYGFVTRPTKLLVVDVRKRCLVDLPIDEKYCALSYVWGGAQVLQLNHSNAAGLRQHGALDKYGSLPATIRDAIEVTKQIGLQYLWIDTLCIQQDAPDETLYQVSNMHNIFGSAYVTIVAAGGDNADVGLAGARDNSRQIQYGTALAETEPGKPIVQYLGPGLLLGLVSLTSWSSKEKWDIAKQEALPTATAISSSTWNGRAWTFQEALLSSRALVFIDGQVFWHCNKALWGEPVLGRKLSADGFAVDNRYQHLENLTSNPHFLGTWKKHDASIEVRRDGRTLVVSSEAFSLYKDIVGGYTPRGIGRFSDRLAAFVGIGNVLEQCLKSSLLYGLPESLLDCALLWQPRSSVEAVAWATNNFPSWSWCAWKGAVQYSAQYGVEAGQPRELHEYESAEERIRPLVRWYKAGEDGLFEPINLRGIGIREALGSTGSLPDNWDGVLAPSEDRNIDIDISAPFPHLLRCYTMKATVHVGPVSHHEACEEVRFVDSSDHDMASVPNHHRLYDPNNGSLLGEVVLDCYETPLRSSGTRGSEIAYEIDLVALSETQFFRSHALNTISLRRNLYKRPFSYSLYNAMAVRWDANTGTGYRIGLARVLQDGWHKLGGSMTFGWVNLA